MEFLTNWWNNLKGTIASKYIASAVRHGLSVVAGALVSWGVLAPEAVNQFVDSNSAILVGLASYLIAQYFSAKKVSVEAKKKEP